MQNRNQKIVSKGSLLSNGRVDTAPKRVLLFGPYGQVGRALTDCLSTSLQNLELILVDRSQINLSDWKKIAPFISGLNPDAVINAAAYTNVEQAENDIEQTYLVNAIAPARIAETCGNLGIPFIHYSTDYVFDGIAQQAYSEDSSPNPLNIYGKTKAIGEALITATTCAYFILRTSWVYHNIGRNFRNTILRIAKEQKKLRVVADQVGAPTSADYIAEGTVRVLKSLLWSYSEGDRMQSKGIYHLTASGACSWYQFAQMLLELEKTVNPFQYELFAVTSAEFPTKARRPAYTILANQKIAFQFGVQQKSWQACLQELVRKEQRLKNLKKTPERSAL